MHELRPLRRVRALGGAVLTDKDLEDGLNDHGVWFFKARCYTIRNWS